MLYVTGHEAFGKEVVFCVPTADPQTAWSVPRRVREKLLARAREMGIDLPDDTARMAAA